MRVVSPDAVNVVDRPSGISTPAVPPSPGSAKLAMGKPRKPKTAIAKPKRSTELLTTVAVALALVVAGAAYAAHSLLIAPSGQSARAGPQAELRPRPQASATRRDGSECPVVRTISWDPAASFSAISDIVTNVSTAREPVVWTGVPLPEGFDGGTCQSMPRSGSVMRLRTPVFDWEQRNLPYAYAEEEANTWVHDATCDKFFETDAYTYSTEQVYNAEGCESSQVMGTCTDTTTPEARAVAAAMAVREVAKVSTTVGLWMTSRGMVTAAHTDLYHNVVLQLAGQKRWTLAPASETPQLRPFPHPHPRARRSQAGLPPLQCGAASNGTAWAPDRRPLFADEKLPEVGSEGGDPWPLAQATHEVVLRPGDLLYLPPLTYHRVASPPDGSLSIGLNAFSRSAETQVDDDGRAAVDEFLTWAERAARDYETSEVLLATFVRHLVQGVLQPELGSAASATVVAAVASSFLRPALSSKWSPLYGSIDCQSFDAAQCPTQGAGLSTILLQKCQRFAERTAMTFGHNLESTGWLPENAVAVTELLLMQLVEYTTIVVSPARQCSYMRCLTVETSFPPSKSKRR